MPEPSAANEQGLLALRLAIIEAAVDALAEDGSPQAAARFAVRVTKALTATDEPEWMHRG